MVSTTFSLGRQGQARPLSGARRDGGPRLHRKPVLGCRMQLGDGPKGGNPLATTSFQTTGCKGLAPLKALLSPWPAAAGKSGVLAALQAQLQRCGQWAAAAACGGALVLGAWSSAPAALAETLTFPVAADPEIFQIQKTLVEAWCVLGAPAYRGFLPAGSGLGGRALLGVASAALAGRGATSWESDANKRAPHALTPAGRSWPTPTSTAASTTSTGRRSSPRG